MSSTSSIPHNPASVLISELQNQLQFLVRQTNIQSNVSNISLWNDIGIYIREIEKQASQSKTRKEDDSEIVFANMRVTSYSDRILADKNEAQIFQIIINELIGYPIEGVEHFIESRSDIALQIGKILKDYNDSWIESNERSYINALLDNIESYTPFDLLSHSSLLFQSLAAFFLKGDDSDKLTEYLFKNGIGDHRIALGFWGATFGFAALPKTLSSKIFNPKSTSFDEQYYHTLQKQLHEHNKIPKSSSAKQNQNLLTQRTETLEKVHVETAPVANTIKKGKDESQIKIGQKQEELRCPICGSDMVPREGKYGPFYGCSKYGETKCSGIVPMKKQPQGKTYSKTAAVIIDYIDKNGHSRLSDIKKELKIRRSITYSVQTIEDLIKDELSEKYEFEKINTSKGVKARSGMF